MELHDVHKAQIARYTSWFANKRTRAVSDRDSELEDFKSDRLVDESALFNYADVVDLLNTYHQQVMGRFREELELEVNQSANFISHLMAQAEANGVYLQVEDITVIEDQARVGQMGALSAMNMAMPPLQPKPRQTLESVQPVGAGGGDNTALLQEIQDMKEEKRLMAERCSRVEFELTNLSRERSNLSAEVSRLQEAAVSAASGVDQTAVHAAEYARQLAETRQAYETKFAECNQLSAQLTQRLGDSAQFNQLKHIVKQKTSEVKELKSRLVAAGLMPSDADGCVELAADSD